MGMIEDAEAGRGRLRDEAPVCSSQSSGSQFHQWLRTQDQWVIAVAQSDIVYQAMKLSYDANMEDGR